MSSRFMRFAGAVAAGIGNLDSYTEEHQRFLRSGYVCQNCGAELGSAWGLPAVVCKSADGQQIPLFSARTRGARFQCTKCSFEWTLRHQGGGEQKSVPDRFEIVETERFEEHLGTDRRRISNSGSSAPVRRRILAARRWSRRLEWGESATTSASGGLSIGVDELATLKAGVEQAVERRYSSTEEAHEEFSEEIEIEVPAHTNLEVELRWKRLWQRGYVVITDSKGASSQHPFKVATGLSFDQVQSEYEAE